MKRALITICICALILLSVPASLLGVWLATPDLYAQTFYGELAPMYDKLCAAEGKKIVVIGGSSVSFGIDSRLAQEELARCGLSYTVCNFGLYGALGTKLMLELSRGEIGEGDIVVFMPEISQQTMSLYFSAAETWRAVNTNVRMFGALDDADKAAMVGGFVSFAAEKFSYTGKSAPAGSGIYARSSFDDNCDLKKYARPFNIMPGGWDKNNVIDLAAEIPGDDFIAYVNEYAASVAARGARMYYYLPPMNVHAVQSGAMNIEEYAAALGEKLAFPLMGDPYDALMDSEWFYDSNFHLNAAGMTARTATFADDIKTRLGVTAPSGIQVPAKPVTPPSDDPVLGDDKDAACFLYEEGEEGYTIVGLSEAGRGRETLQLPYTYNGRAVRTFTADTFAGNTVIREIVIGKNIDFIPDRAFDGCTSLETLRILQLDPSALRVGMELLAGADNCTVCVPESVLNLYINDYFWGFYMGRLEGFGI